MNHKQAEERNIAELYLAHRLPPDEELAFEEHLLTCKKCRKKIRKLEYAKEAVKLSNQELFRDSGQIQAKGDKKIRNFFSFYHIAAAIIVIVAFTAIVIIFSDKKMSPSVISTIPEKDYKSFTPGYQADSSDLITDSDSSLAGAKKEMSDYIVENFTPSSFYEKLVNENYRNTGLIIKDPVGDTLPHLPSFAWENSVYESLILVITNNHEKKIFTGIIKNGSTPDVSIGPGLYYWQLQDQKETLFTGRFIILPLNGR